MKINLDILIQLIKQALIPDGKNKKQIIHLPFLTDGTHQEKAPEGNLTKLMEFVLLDFADVPHLQGFLFGLFLLIYIVISMAMASYF